MYTRVSSKPKQVHKCAYPRCTQVIDIKYRYCFEHRDTIYEDFCRIHGKTKFQQGRCLQCDQLKTPIYRVTHRGKNWYDKDAVRIDENHWLYPYLSRLTSRTRKSQEAYIQKISHRPGIYGIFVRKQNQLGKCLYVGQSVNVSQRVHQHRECFKKAQKHILGVRMRRKHASITQLKPYKTEFKYYRMADKYKLSDLKFVRLMSLPVKNSTLSMEQYKDLLTYAEQAMIDAYKPSLNLFAARPSV